MGDDQPVAATPEPLLMLPARTLRHEPNWRFVEFFFTIRWPVAFPEHIFPVAYRNEAVDWMPIHPGRLSRFFGENVAQLIAASGNRNFVAFRFKRFPIEHDSPRDRYDAVHKFAFYSRFSAKLTATLGDPILEREPAPRIETYETIVRAGTCIIDDSSGNFVKVLQDAFDRCLDEFRLLVESYAQTAEDLHVGVVTRASLAYPWVPAVLFDPMTGAKTDSGVKTGGDLPPLEMPRDLNESEFEEVLIRSELAKRGEPYAGIRQWQRIALRANDVEGEYALAVVAAHTVGEMHFDAFLLRMAWEEITYGLPDAPTREDVIGWFSLRSTLKTRLCGQYHKRLTGKWACGEPGNPIHTWLEKASRAC